MKVHNHFEILNYNTSILRIPFTIVHIIITLVLILLISFNGALLGEIIILITGCALFIILHWYANYIYIRIKSYYLSIQAILVFIISMAVNEFSIIVLIIFGGTLIAQSFYLYNKVKSFIMFSILYLVYGLSIMNHVYEQDKFDYALFIFFVSLILMLLGIATFNQKEVENRELLMANKRIEALTKQNERQRMARDLHDSLIQRLIGVNLKMEVMEEYLEDGNVKETSDILKLVKTQVEQSIVEAREVVDDLRLSEELIINHRLVNEVKDLMTLFSIPIEVKLEENIVVDEEMANHLIAILKEAVTNTFKHAQANKIFVTARIHTNLLVLVIEDNGLGYQNTSKIKHYGIIGMKERTAILNGQFNIACKAGTGTRIEVKIPL